MTDVWLVMRRLNCAPRLDLVCRCVSNGPSLPITRLDGGCGASLQIAWAQGPVGRALVCFCFHGLTLLPMADWLGVSAPVGAAMSF